MKSTQEKRSAIEDFGARTRVFRWQDSIELSRVQLYFQSIFFSVRVMVYFMSATVLFQLMVFTASGTGNLGFAQEGGWLETFQSGSIAITAFWLLFLAKDRPLQRPVLLLLSCLAWLAFIREGNNTAIYRKIFFFRHASTLFSLSIIGALALKFRSSLGNGIKQFLKTNSSVIFAAGFIVVVGWSQTLAQRQLFPDRTVDRLVEEASEAAGYLIILFGVFEVWLSQRD